MKDVFIKFITNPFILLICCIFIIKLVNDFIIKYRSHKLLKILYRIMYYEKRQVAFYFKQTGNLSYVYGSDWNIEDIEDMTESMKNITEDKILNNYITISHNKKFTYYEYLKIFKKFNNIIIKPRIDINLLEKDEFQKYMNLIENKNIFPRNFLFDNSFKNIYEEYYIFPPTSVQIMNMLKYLKKELYIINEYNVKLTKKAYESLNLPEKLDDFNINNMLDIMTKIK